jgi:DNA polymerase (family X)
MPDRIADATLALTNPRIAALLSELADLLDIKGESSFKANAYRRAADAIARAPVEVVPAYQAGHPPTLPGVGKGIAYKLEELARTGSMTELDELRVEIPAGVAAMLRLTGVGPRTAGELWRSRGIGTLEELEAAARAGRLRGVRGIGAERETRILESLDQHRRRPSRRLLMGDAQALAERLVALAEALPEVRSATIAGSVRRGVETVGDLDMLVETADPGTVMGRLLAAIPHEGDDDAEPGAHGTSRASLALREGPQLDIMTAPPDRLGSYLVHFTGSAAHNVRLRQRAKQRGRSLSEHGLIPLDPSDPDSADLPALETFPSEAALYAWLDLAPIPAELREDRGEIEAAADGRLPRLVTRADLIGDCHSHSDWSDGRTPLERMVETARVMGQQWLVLTDHSWSLTIAKGLGPDRVEQQRRLIGEMNERFAREVADGTAPESAHPGFRLLHGCELEITIDGRLDYEDELLERFDVVVASLHVGRRQPREQLMARYEVALRSPHVDILAHPSGRKIGRRPDLDLDWDAFYRRAAETGTFLEINGSEDRLDLDDERIRVAREAGCRFTIDSDAHDPTEWQHLVWGTTIARRAWVEPELVANTRPLDAFLALIEERSRGV